ncbi:hypothetical protein ACFHWS_02940 [Micromonospora sp. LOL_013]|uniref:hypothetical protein n=1 Tax=Micromonospora sp. LOL_013 TaxID=3345414 RepID=UPI003A89E17A
MTAEGRLIDLDRSTGATAPGAPAGDAARRRFRGPGRLVGMLLAGVAVGGLGGWLLNDYQHQRAAADTAGSVVAFAGEVWSAADGQLNAKVTVANTGTQRITVRVLDTESPGLAVADTGAQARVRPGGVGSVDVRVTFDCDTIMHRLATPLPMRFSATTDAGRTVEVTYPMAVTGRWPQGTGLSCREGLVSGGRTVILLPGR